MSKQHLQMMYHPAKKEIEFTRYLAGQPVVVRTDSTLAKYMNEKGKFILQDQGNSFFEDIARAFDGEKSVHIEVVTTKKDYEDFEQMVEYYNQSGSVKITANLLSELPDMEDTYRVVREHGEKSISILKRHQTQFFDVPLENPSVKKCVEMFSGEVQNVVDDIRAKIDGMAINSVNLCFAGVYSAGKSALINAILGYRILPEADASKTACMTKITSPDSKNPTVRLTFTIHSHYVEIVWNDKNKVFEFAAGPNENPTRKKIQDCINKNSDLSQHGQLYTIMETVNGLTSDDVISPERVGSSISVYFPIPLDNDLVCFVIYDTPGTDSNYGEHQQVLQDALSKQTHSILIFVATPTKLEGAGNNALLTYLKKAGDADRKTSIDMARSLFVINHADDSDAAKLKLIADSTVTHAEDENISIPLKNKKLFFTSALYGYCAKSVLNGSASDEEKETVEVDYVRVTTPRRGQFYKLNRVAESERLRDLLIERSDRQFSDSQSKDDKAKAFYICSGLYALESEISTYGEKYAAAVRAYAIIDSVDKALSATNRNAKSLERQNQEDIDSVNSEIESLRNVIASGIQEAYSKYDYPPNSPLPSDMLQSLQLTSEYIKEIVADKALSFIEKLLKGWFFGFGKVNFNEKHKTEITQRITAVLSDYINEFLVKRQYELEQVRDSFTDDIKRTIQANGRLSDEAKKYVLEIRSPEIKSVAEVASLGEIYDSRKRVDKFLWVDTPHVDKKGFIEDLDRKLTEIVRSMQDEFEKDFRETLASVLSAVKAEFTQNTEKYSVLIQAKLADKEVMEQLRGKIADAAHDLKNCQRELNEVIWSVKENG